MNKLKAMTWGVNAYIVKPMSFKQLSATIRTLNNFWDPAQIPQDA